MWTVIYGSDYHRQSLSYFYQKIQIYLFGSKNNFLYSHLSMCLTVAVEKLVIFFFQKKSKSLVFFFETLNMTSAALVPTADWKRSLAEWCALSNKQKKKRKDRYRRTLKRRQQKSGQRKKNSVVTAQTLSNSNNSSSNSASSTHSTSLLAQHSSDSKNKRSMSSPVLDMSSMPIFLIPPPSKKPRLRIHEQYEPESPPNVEQFLKQRYSLDTKNYSFSNYWREITRNSVKPVEFGPFHHSCNSCTGDSKAVEPYVFNSHVPINCMTCGKRKCTQTVAVLYFLNNHIFCHKCCNKITVSPNTASNSSHIWMIDYNSSYFPGRRRFLR